MDIKKISLSSKLMKLLERDEALQIKGGSKIKELTNTHCIPINRCGLKNK